MSHPTSKRHRQVLRKAKGRRRVANLSPNDRLLDLALLACMRGTTGRLCSCWACKRPRYQRHHFGDANKMVEL